MDDLVMTQKEQEQIGTKKETGNSGNKSSGSGGNGTVNLDYAPIAPEMPTVEAEERKGSKSSKAKKRKRSEKRHFSEEQKKILRETPDDQEYSSGLGKTGNIDRKFTKSDSARLWRKDELLNSADFEEAVDHTKKFQSILDKLRKYALLDVTGMEQKLGWDDYYNLEQNEAKELQNVLQELEAWRVPAPDDDEILARERGLCEAYYQRLKPLSEGALEVKMNEGTHLDRTKAKTFRTRKGVEESIEMRDMKSVPLFAHEPSVNDIKQVALGDCYLQASLATLAENEPETIKRMFRDNGDGTVVVRFYSVTENEKKENTEKKENNENKENQENNANPSPEKKEDSKYKFSSLYVTVKKQVPKYAKFSEGSFWVKLIQLAYAASGLTKGLDDKPKAAPKSDAKIDYGDIVSGDERMSLMELTGRPMEDMEFSGHHSDIGKRLMEVVSEASKTQRNSANGQKMSSAIADLKESAEKYPNAYEPCSPFADIAWYASEFVDDMGGKLKLGSLFTVEAITKTVKDWMTDLAFAVQEKYKGADSNGDPTYQRMASAEDFVTVLTEMSPSNLRDSELGKKYNRLAKKGGKNGANGNSAGAIDLEAQAQEAIRNTKADFLKLLLTIVKSKLNMFSTDTKTEENFGKAVAGSKAEQIWNQLQAWKTQRKSIAAAAQGDSWFGTLEERTRAGQGQSAGEKTIKGLAGSHAYSVMGTRERGDRRYVLLRNPWGNTAREYVVQPGGKIDAKAVENIQTCGIFLLEINDFALNFQRISAV